MIFFIETTLLIFSIFLSISIHAQGTNGIEEKILKFSTSKPWEIIESLNYPIENHEIQTEDGYILSVQRIPHGRKNKNQNTKVPILIISGLFMNNLLWILDENYLPYILAELGYDIWLLNNRGSFSKHKYLNSNSSEYWNFSFHEMGVYDVPNTIDYILNNTGQKSVHCIAFSQGGTSLAIMLSKLPEYNKKVKLATFFAPGVYLSHTLRIGQMLSKSTFYQHVEEFIEKFGYFNVFGEPGLFQALLVKEFCKGQMLKLCASIVMYIVGPNYPNIDWKNLPIVLSHNPTAASAKQLTHFSQFVSKGYFAEYAPYKDFLMPNYKPKLYNITAITVPSVVFYGKNDWIIPQQDVMKFINQLPNLVMKHLVDDPYFNHLDFLIGINKYEMVYKILIEILKKF